MKFPPSFLFPNHRSTQLKHPISFKDSYPNFYNFLRTSFPPDMITIFNEEEVIKAYVDTDLGFEEIIAEGKQLIAVLEFPWQELIAAASHIFKDSDEARQWLAYTLDLMEKELKLCIARDQAQGNA